MGEDKENEEEIEMEYAEIDHICEYNEDDFCPICESFLEPDDFTGSTEGDR